MLRSSARPWPAREVWPPHCLICLPAPTCAWLLACHTPPYSSAGVPPAATAHCRGCCRQPQVGLGKWWRFHSVQVPIVGGCWISFQQRQRTWGGLGGMQPAGAGRHCGWNQPANGAASAQYVPPSHHATSLPSRMLQPPLACASCCCCCFLQRLTGQLLRPQHFAGHSNG